MDDIVRQALAKWPDVPACYGWLLLDRRGNWRMRDEVVQREHGLGAPIRHVALRAFIERNYDADELGQWYFQNGPQRVYVELAYAPWVVRLIQNAGGEFDPIDQTGSRWELSGSWLDDRGAVLLTGHTAGDPRERVGVLHDHDLDLFADRLRSDDGGDPEPSSAPGDPPQRFAWRSGVTLPVLSIRAEDIPQRFGFVASPAARAE